MNIQAVIVNGQKIIPTVKFELQTRKVIDVQTNVQRKKMLIAQLAEQLNE
ncbi:hypothetical protein [Planomicrobium sp. Y74]|nr:hypothetical protein [Planomicrobium sp. Y74]